MSPAMADPPRVHNAVWQPRNKKGQFKRVVPKSEEFSAVGYSSRGKQVIILESDDEDGIAELNPTQVKIGSGGNCNAKGSNPPSSRIKTSTKKTNQVSQGIVFHCCDHMNETTGGGAHNARSEDVPGELEGMWEEVSLKFKETEKYICDEMDAEADAAEFNSQTIKECLDWLFDEVVGFGFCTAWQ